MRARIVSSPARVRFLEFCFAAALTLVRAGGLIGQDQKTQPAKASNPHSATITWTASTSPVVGYNVYRSTPQNRVVKLTRKPINATEYTDKTVEAGETYIYSVTSVDSKGVESRPSEGVSVTVPVTTKADTTKHPGKR